MVPFCANLRRQGGGRRRHGRGAVTPLPVRPPDVTPGRRRGRGTCCRAAPGGLINRPRWNFKGADTDRAAREGRGVAKKMGQGQQRASGNRLVKLGATPFDTLRLFDPSPFHLSAAIHDTVK